MKDNSKTKDQLLQEVASLHNRIKELEVSDIERKRADVALRETSDYLENLINYANAPIIVWDPSFKITRFNHAFEHLAGYKAKEVIGKELRMLFPEASREESLKKIKNALDGEYWESVEIPISHQDGRTLIALWNSANILAKDSKTVIATIAQGQDITERKRADVALRESEEWLSTTLNSIGDAVIATDVKGNVTFLNPIAENITGWKQETASGKPVNKIFNIINEETGKPAENPVERVLREGVIVGLANHTVLIAKDGTKYPIDDSGAPIKDDKGNTIGVALVFHDITERKRAEEALKESEEKLRNIVEYSSNLFYSHTSDHVLTYMSPQTREFLDCEPEEALICWTELVTDNPVNEIGFNNTVKAIETGEPQPPYELELIGKKGRIIWVEVHEAPIIKDDKTVAIVGALVDITDRKRAEEKLKESEEKFREMAELLPEIVYETDLKGNLTFVSHVAFKQFGYTVKDFEKGVNLEHMLVPEDRERALMTVKKILRGEKFGANEYKALHKDGSTFDIIIHSTPIIKEGKPTGLRGVIVDINELKKAEETLKQSEKNYRDLFNNATDAIYIQDKEGRFLDVNQGAVDMYGYPKEFFIGKTPAFLSAPGKNDMKKILGYVEEAFNGKPRQYDFWGIRKNGEVFPKIVRSQQGFYLDQKVIITYALDITERKRAEEALKHKLLLLSQPAGEIGDLKLTDVIDVEVFQKLQDGFADSYDVAALIYDDQGNPLTEPSNFSDFCRIIRSTEKGMQRCRMSKANISNHVKSGSPVATTCTVFEEVLEGAAPIFLGDRCAGTWGIGQKLSKKIPEEKLRNFAREIGVDEDEFVAAAGKLKVGTKKQFEQTVSFLKIITDNISLLGMQNIQQAQDITKRKQAEEALRESEEQYRNLAESLQEGLGVVDLDENIVFANKAYCNILRYPKDEIIGLNLCDIVAEDDFARILKETVKRKLGKKSTYELVLRCKDGELRDAMISVSPLMDEQGQYQGALGLILDITEQKRAEEERRKLEAQIQHAQKLESLGVLAGGIAHDFNNLLTGILGNAELALMELSPTSPVRDTIEEITQVTMRAAELSKQMLAYSGKGKFVIRRINLSKVVEEMTHLLKVSISKNAVLKFNFAKDLPAIEVDITQVRQVVMNLIINASEAIGDKSGVISISTGVMECDRDYLATTYINEDLEEGYYVFLEVADTGCGMEKDTVSKIYDPFFTTKFTGRGLGLAAVLGIIRGHKGAVKVYSEVGQGTTFKLLFPASGTKADPLDERDEFIEEMKGSGHILVVDDEETIRTITKRTLKRFGYTVTLAADGRKAVEMFQKQPGIFDLILLDMTMPHMNGEEAFREIQRIKKDTRVILCSGYNEQDATNRFAGKGLAGFIQKPYGPKTLITKVNEILKKSKK